MPTARQLVEQSKKYINDVKTALTLANQAYDKVSEDLSYANSRLDFKKRSDYPSVYIRSFLRETRASGRLSTILKEEIEEAVKTDTEFSREHYLQALYLVANDLDIFNIKFAGSGWRTRAAVVITFEESAGSLEDWARGISNWREAVGTEVEEGINKGARATRFWYNRIYRNPTLALDTFKGRLAYAGRPAPFWQILNSGTPASMPSDRGDGSYNPIPAVPTDFIGSAERRIALLFTDVLQVEHELWTREIKALESEIRDGYELLNEIRDLIDSLKADEALDRYIIQTLNSRSKSGDISEYVDKDKLREAIRKHRAGEEFTTKQIELTAANAARRVRPRVSSFIRLIEGYEEL